MNNRERIKKLTEEQKKQYVPSGPSAPVVNEEEIIRERAAAKLAPKPPRPMKERLPHLSQFIVTYDADAALWRGTLNVPGMEPIKGQHSGLFRLLGEVLDEKYREVKRKEQGQ